MAGLEIGNLAGAVTNLTTALQKERGAKAFIDAINGFGIQVQNNFEVNFSGIPNVTFFIQNIDVPGIKTNYASLNYDGRQVEIPVNYEYDRSFSITVYNDAQGYIYTAVTEFMMASASGRMANSGYTLTIKALTGDEKHYKGSLITMRGVRIENVSGLSFGYGANDVQTFTISGKLIDFSYTPGALSQVAGILGTVESLVR